MSDIERNHLLQTAREVLDGTLTPVEASRVLSRLAHRVSADPVGDPNLVVFIGVDSETDALPVGDVRAQWNRGALREKDLEIARANDLYRESVERACRNILRRYTDQQGPA